MIKTFAFLIILLLNIHAAHAEDDFLFVINQSATPCRVCVEIKDQGTKWSTGILLANAGNTYIPREDFFEVTCPSSPQVELDPGTILQQLKKIKQEQAKTMYLNEKKSLSENTQIIYTFFDIADEKGNYPIYQKNKTFSPGKKNGFILEQVMLEKKS